MKEKCVFTQNINIIDPKGLAGVIFSVIGKTFPKMSLKVLENHELGRNFKHFGLLRIADVSSMDKLEQVKVAIRCESYMLNSFQLLLGIKTFLL